MISIEKLGSSLSNLKEKNVPIPRDNIFTQQTMYDMRLNELRALQEVDNEINSLIDYTMTNEFANRVINEEDKNNLVEIDTSIPTEAFMTYLENEVVDIPEVINDIISNKNEWYIYGLSNPDSIYKSFILLSQPDYILKSNSDKLNYVATFKREVAIQLEQMFKKYKYYKHKFSKTDMLNELLNTNIINYPLITLMIDYIKSDVCILDIINKKYLYYSSITRENNNFHFILKDKDVYLPLMNSNGTHLFSQETYDLIKIYFEKDIIPAQYKERVLGNNSDNLNAETKQEDTSVLSSIDETLKSEKSYTLKQLQDLASERGVDIHKLGKKKTINKTKNELYQEIKAIIEC